MYILQEGTWVVNPESNHADWVTARLLWGGGIVLHRLDDVLTQIAGDHLDSPYPTRGAADLEQGLIVFFELRA